jgi:hypothetical protein
MKNIEVTFDALKAFYQEHAPEKMMEMDDKKLQVLNLLAVLVQKYKY